MFQSNKLPPSPTMMVEEEGSSKTLIPFYQTTSIHIPENGNLQSPS